MNTSNDKFDFVGEGKLSVIESAVKKLINNGDVTLKEGLAIINAVGIIQDMYDSGIPITPDECTTENGTMFPVAISSLNHPRGE